MPYKSRALHKTQGIGSKDWGIQALPCSTPDGASNYLHKSQMAAHLDALLGLRRRDKEENRGARARSPGLTPNMVLTVAPPPKPSSIATRRLRTGPLKTRMPMDTPESDFSCRQGTKWSERHITLHGHVASTCHSRGPATGEAT